MNQANGNVNRNDDADISDESLLARFIAGDQDSFTEIVDRYQRELYAFIIRYVGDQATAEDLFQETFIQLHRSAQMFDQQRRLKPWLFTIAANKARDYLRAAGRRPVQRLDAHPNGDDSGSLLDLVAGTSPDASTAAMMSEDAHHVREVLSGMSPIHREAIIMSFYQRLSYKEMAEILGVPLGTVKSRLHIALQNFARLYEARAGDRGQKRSADDAGADPK
ncbi:MAG: RNA polymerase sigma factor [Phycisphaerae bacterium]